MDYILRESAPAGPTWPIGSWFFLHYWCQSACRFVASLWIKTKVPKTCHRLWIRRGEVGNTWIMDVLTMNLGSRWYGFDNAVAFSNCRGTKQMLILAFPMKRGQIFCCILVRGFSLTWLSLSLYSERQLGGLDVFLKYAQNYVQTFVGQSIGTDTWKEHLYSYFKANGGDAKIAILDAVDWNVGDIHRSSRQLLNVE